MHGLNWYTIFMITLLLAVTLRAINGQTVRPHMLCSNSTVTVPAGASGVIQHVKEERDTPCTLRLRGFASGSYLSLPGLDTSTNNCGASVTVNSVNYCVKGSQSHNSVIIQLTGGELSVTLPSARENNFEFTYYSNVAICNGNLTIPEGAEASQLSGVISSSYDPSLLTQLEDCRVEIELPSSNVTLRFELLSTSGGIDIQVGDKMIPTSASTGNSRLVMIRSGKSISLSATNSDDDDDSPLHASFVIRVTVLHCEAIPEIPHSTNSTTPTPWLPGSEVTYSCVSGWMLNQSKENSIDCQVDDNSKTARWTSHTNILCIPEPWCQTPPSQVSNSVYKVGEDNLTATYECIKGYTTNSSESEKKIVCSSPDRLTTPWEWSSATFQCLPVECMVNQSLSPLGVNETSFADGDSGYYVNSTFLYECKFGYKKLEMGEIRCTADGSWSSTPDCTQTAECSILISEGITRTAYGNSTDRHYVNSTFFYECEFGYKKLEMSEIRCTADGNWSSSPDCTKTVECNLTADYPNILNGRSAVKRYYFEETLNYTCDDGYKAVTEVICTSHGTWSSTPNCGLLTTVSPAVSESSAVSQQTECNLTADYPNILNGRSAVKRYYHEDRLSYTCDDGYKAETEVICTSDGTWSTTPNCSADTFSESQMRKEIEIKIIGSVGGLVGLLLVVGVVVYLCLHRSRDKKTENGQRGFPHSDATSSYHAEENHYHALEPPSEIPVDDDVAPGAYSMATLSDRPAGSAGAQANTKISKNSDNPLKDKTEPAQDVHYTEVKPVRSTLRSPPSSKKKETLQEPVYAEPPDLPARLDTVILNENNPYEIPGAPADTTEQSQPIEMLDNDLYDCP